jgi:hypothetical protein
MGKGGAARRQQAAIAISKKRAAKKKKTKGRFPGDINKDGRVNAADFRMARKKGLL